MGTWAFECLQKLHNIVKITEIMWLVVRLMLLLYCRNIILAPALYSRFTSGLCQAVHRVVICAPVHSCVMAHSCLDGLSDASCDERARHVYEGLFDGMQLHAQLVRHLAQDSHLTCA